MKKIFAIVVLVLAFAAIAPAQTSLQTACQAPTAATTPCVNATWTNSSMAAAVTTNASGQETSGPGTAEIWGCVGTATSTQCTPAMMPAVASETPAQGSAWVLLGTIAQTQAAGSAGVANLNWGTMYQIAVRNLWTASGGPGAFSNVLQIQINPVPVTRPAAASSLGAAIVYPSTN
jgi:hypothetical protein